MAIGDAPASGGIAPRALVTTTNLKFAEGARALLESVRRHHPEVVRYCLTLPEEREALMEVLGDVAEVIGHPGRIPGVAEAQRLKALRIFMVELPAEVVAYVDADAIFCAPAPELWEVPAGKVVCVEQEALSLLDNISLGEEARKRFAELFPHVVGQRGFNTGVMALRPQDWRDLPERFEEVFGRFSTAKNDCFDQPLLNAILLPFAEWLPFKFNAHGLWQNPVPSDVRIVHFTGKRKPWAKEFPKHEPAYYLWLRHGENCRDPWQLAAAKCLTLTAGPRRALYRLRYPDAEA